MRRRGEDGDGSLSKQLAASRRVVTRLRAENADLKLLLVELQRALDAANADVGRYRDLYEASVPNRPERVPRDQQASALEDLLRSLHATLVDASVANDLEEGREEEEEDDGDADAAATDAALPKRKRDEHGRAPVDSSRLPTHTVFVDPPEVLAADGVGFTLVGSEASDRLAHSPGRYIRLRIVRRTYRWDAVSGEVGASETSAARDADPPPDAVLLTAPIPDAVWPRVLADPSAIAHAIISKYDDLLPLHRQEGISRRNGYVVPRSTLCGWFNAADKVVTHVVEAMFADAKRTAFCLATDATGVRVRTDFAPCDPWSVFVFVGDRDHVIFRRRSCIDTVARDFPQVKIV